MHMTIYSLISFCPEYKLFNMIVSKGFKKTFWLLKFLRSSFSRNLSASYLIELIAYITT
jgi:hypothetical protein